MAVCSALAHASAAVAFRDEPGGYGPATWGTSVSTVRAHFPGLQLAEAPKSTEGLPLALETHLATGQRILGLEGCTVRFFFVNDQLYRVGFKCEGDARLLEVLAEHFGPPSMEMQGTVHWLSERRAVSARAASRHFSFTDRVRDAAVQVQLMKRVQQEGRPTEAVASPEPAHEAEPPSRAWLAEEGRLAGERERLARASTPQELAYRIGNLGVFEDPGQVPTIARYLEHEDELVFESAVAALETVGGAASVRALGGVLTRPQAPPERRLRILEALMFLRAAPGSSDALAKALADPDARVRREAAMTLAVTAGPEVLPAVRLALDREADAPTRQILERTLEVLEAPKPIPPAP